MKILSLNDNNFEDCLRLAQDVLNADGAVILPTETVYGIAVRATSNRALQHLRKLKSRELTKALPVQVANIEQVNTLVKLSSKSIMLFEKFSPGPLTIVLPPLGKVNKLISGETHSIGVRIPSHPFTLKLLQSGALAVPSANPIGQSPAMTMAQAIEYFPSGVDLAIDAGACQSGLSSTVLSMIDDNPVILRQGQISELQIKQVLDTKTNASK